MGIRFEIHCTFAILLLSILTGIITAATYALVLGLTNYAWLENVSGKSFWFSLCLGFVCTLVGASVEVQRYKYQSEEILDDGLY